MRSFLARLFAVVTVASLTGCGYALVGLESPENVPTALNQGLVVQIDDPLGLQADLIQRALDRQGLAGDGLTLVIEEFTVDRES